MTGRSGLAGDRRLVVLQPNASILFCRSGDGQAGTGTLSGGHWRAAAW
ncbi:hypothetical protein [Streptomyces yangpuensis]